MADVKGNINKLYTALSGAKLINDKDESSFGQHLSDSNYRLQVFGLLRKNGASGYGNNYGDFKKFIGYDNTEQRKETAKQALSGGTQRTSTPPSSQQQTPTPMQLPEGFGQLNTNLGETEEQRIAREASYGWTQDLGGQIKKSQDTTIHKALQGDREASKAVEKQTRKRLQQRLDEAEYEKETGKQLRNTGVNFSFEAPTIARDENGEMLRGENGEPLIGRTTDEAKAKTHQQVKKEQEEYKSIEDQLKEAYAERMELQRKMSEVAKRETANRKGPRFPLMTGGTAETYTMSEDSKNLSSAMRLLERRIDALEAKRDDAGFWRGTGDTLSDPSSYSFGLTDLADASVMSDLKSKLDKAKEEGTTPVLTDSEQALVRNYMKNEEADQLNAENWWYNAGQGFGETLSFMKDFAVTGGGFANIAKAGMRAGAKGGAKAASQLLGDYMTKNLGTKALGKTIEYSGKAAGLMAGAEAGGFLLNNTVQAASSAADILNRQTGNLTLDKDGNLTFEGGKSLGEAFLTSQISRTGENGSELVGVAFDAIPGILGRVIQRTTPGKVLKRITDSKFWKKGENALDYLGVQSVWGEGMEEEYGMARTEILNTITNGNYDSNGSGLFDLDRQIDTWKTVGLTSMILRVPSMIVSGTQAANYYANRYNLNTSDNNMRETFDNTERYSNVKNMIDNADNKQIAGVLSNLMKNAQLSTEEKRAIMLYANDLVKMRGFNIGNVVAAANGYQAPPRVSNYNIRGLHVDAVDEKGNVLESYDYKSQDELKTGLYEMQQKRADEKLQSDIGIMKSRPDNQFFEFALQFIESNPDYAVYDKYDDFVAVLNKPSMERTEEEQQMVAAFADQLHNAVYDNTILHEEQSQQDGEELADSDSIDIEEDSEQGKPIVDGLSTATENRLQLFANNEELKTEVEEMEKKELPHQEIISNLETFRPEEVQGMIDYYNAKAKYDGYMTRKAQRIDEEASQDRERRTFTGTINGNEDKENLVTITDGENTYTLVSGNITTDKDGRVTGTDSGLMIGLDENGDFVNISDKANVSIVPSGMTLQEYEGRRREELQVAITQKIDSEQRLMPQEQNGDTTAPAETNNIVTESTDIAPSEAETPQETALDRIPKDEGGNPLYEQGAAEDTYDVFSEMTGSEEGASALAQSELNDANKRLKKLQKEQEEQRKGKFKGKTIQEKANEMKETAKAIKAEEGRIKYWNSVLAVPQNRRLEAENNPPAAAPSAPQAPVTPPAAPTDEAPEYRYDTPKAARERGYKVVEGNRIDRQEEKEMPKGMEVEVQYSTKDKVKGHLTVSELDEVQGSHLTNGQRNEKHFLPEAQPKAEFGTDRQAAAQTNASEANFRPKLMITFNGTQSAYSGSASQTNRRGEVIQGNGRRNLAEYIYAPGNEAVAKKYKDFLKAHAAELGTTAEEIDKMEKPFAHIVLDVTDAEAIRLGQFTAQDLESGGKKVPEISNVTTKLGGRYSNLANIILNHEDPDASLSERIEANAETAVKWLNNAGVINNTEAKTLLEDKALARQFLKDVITDQLFKDAHPDLRTMFYELPKNIQSAIISVVGREVAIENGKSILKDIQDSIRVYHELIVSSPEFANAQGANFEKRYAAASAAVNDWLRQINMDGTVNSEKFSNFALELAKLYKSLKDQKTLAGKLREYYDIMGNVPREGGLFDTSATSGAMTREQALEQIFGIKNGTQRTMPVAGHNQEGETGGEGGTGNPQSGERDEGEGGPSDNRGGGTGNAEVEPLGKPKGTGAQSREDYLASHPLTEAQIMADTEATEDEKLNAIDFLKGEDDSAISRFYYDGIYERAQKAEAVPQPTEKKPTPDPMAAIEQAAQSFRKGQKTEENKPAEEKKEKRSEQKSKDQQDIDDALKEFNDFLDNAKGSNVLDKFMRKGLEGNDKAQTNLLDAFTLTNDAQRMFLKDLLRLASKVGYAYIKSGVHDVQEWSRKMSGSIGKKLKEVLGWDDAIVGEFVDEVWNQKYTVDGQRMRLSEHAERLKNNKGEDTAVNVNKKENNEEENVVSSQWQGTVGDMPDWEGLRRGQKRSLLENGERAFRDATVEKPLLDEDVTTEDFKKKYKEVTDYLTYKLDEPYLDRLFEYLWNRMEQARKERKGGNQIAEEKPAEELEGDSAEFAERQYKLTQLSKKIKAKLHGIVNWGDQPKPLSAYKQIAKELGIDNLSDTDLQELIETEVVNLAREIASKEGWTDKQKYDHIVRLYNAQPSLNARDNDRINLQQYSTPAPMAYLMGLFTSKGKKVESGLEPSAGNGMLTIGLPKEKMHVNDIDEMRLSNLQKQGFGEVTSQDGTQSFGGKKYDVIVTNPPFGNVTPKIYDGLYEISGLEHQMAINALESMKDDGRAAIIIGGNTEYNANGSIKGKDRLFLNYLYAHYNVVDVINMDGKTLYSRQGTGYPVRMILINGRKEFNAKDFAPVQSKARAEQVKSYDELFKRVNDDILRDKEHNRDSSSGVHTAESGKNEGLSDNGHAGTSNEKGVRGMRSGNSNGEHQLPAESVNGVRRSDASTETGEGQGNAQSEGNGGVGTRPVLLHGRGNQPEQSGGSQAVSGGNGTREVADGGSNAQRLSGNSVDSRRRLAVEQPQTKIELGTEKVPYRQQSNNPFALQSQMPAAQAEVVKKALEDIGDVDEFLANELGYSSVEDMYRGSQDPSAHGGLAAEQIDSVAMAIHQMKNGDAFIIGDQTGIGKGRQGAALIRWAVKQGMSPIYFTKTPDLFSGVYRDLKDIGSKGLRPFILASNEKGRITERREGVDHVIYELPSKKEVDRVIDYINKNGKLPPEYDYVVTTYSQISGGTMEYENGQKKARTFKKGKSARPADINGQKKRDAIENLAANSIVLMDESHEAGGDSARGSYLQYVSTKAKGITYISATFAKRPDNMPLYSLRTAISKAGVKIEELIDAVKRGGATFQEIMSKALTEAGQMIRRERDMTGVTVDWKGIDDSAVEQKHFEQYDTVIGLFNDIINFQRTYVDPIVNGLNDAAAAAQGAVDHTPGTRDMGISNAPFASRTYNMVKQVLLALKAEEGAKFAVECLKKGEKPVIALENTNEGAADEVSAMGEDMEMPDLSVNLKKGLRGTLRITEKDAFGNSVNREIPFDRLIPEGQARYREIMDAIDKASTGLSLSPIDVIRDYIKKAGYSVEELTGRSKVFDYNEDGTVRRVNRDPKKNKKRASDFNEGLVDALIVNKSACTGIDLHAGIKFKNTDQRHMIVVQAQADINDEVQMRGRTDRTGQKQHSKYTYIVSTIPSEQRLLMMLKAKLRSLDANTTSSQKSKFNEMQVQDIINKYGDDIVVQYLAEHTDLAVKMVDPLKWGKNLGDGWDTMPVETLIAKAEKDGEAGQTASKVLGRMALLTVKEQEKMLAEIGDLYQAEIDRLNEMGENDLEITEMPLRAKTIRKDVWEQGVDPNGNNPFADNSYVEKVQMDVLKKPMKAEEVKRAQAHLLGGKTWDEYKNGVLERVDEWAENKKKETTDTITARAEKKAKAEQERYVKGAKKAQVKNGMTDEEIEKNGQFQYKTIYEQEMTKLDNALDAIDKQKQVFVDVLELFDTDRVFALPSNIYDLSSMTFEPGMGKLIDVKISDNFSTTASTISFATLDGRRKITIPVSGMVKQQNNEKRSVFPVIVSLTAQTKNGMFGSNVANTLRVLEQNIDNWDKLTSSAARKDGYIITGNLLKALVSTREQGVGGKLISYTTDTGEVRQGILMPENFDPKGLTSKTPISSRKEELKYSRDEVVSADGDVKVRVTNDWDWSSRGYNTLELIVPKSKKKGERYFNDEVLLGLMNGQFEGSGKMKAEFPRVNLDAVMKRLDELGVTVTEENNDNISTAGTGRRYSEDIEEGSIAEKEVTNVIVDSTKVKLPTNRNEALEVISKMKRPFINEDQGKEIVVTNSSVKHTAMQGRENADTQCIGVIDQIIANAVKIGEVPPKENKKDSIEKCEIYYCPVNIDGVQYSARLVVNQYKNRGRVLDDYQLYDLRTKEKSGAVSQATGQNALTSLSASDSRYKVKDLIWNNKEKDKDLVGINNRQTRFSEEADSGSQQTEHKSRIAKHIDALVKKLGTKAKTTVYHSFDELPADMKEHIRERERQGRKVRGWYENGHIYLYLPHIDSKYQAEKTLWHETVAHHGLRELVGAENYDRLLRQLWLEHRDGEMGKWVTERMQQNGWNLNEAIDEYLAREAEKNPFKEPSLWQRLRWLLADVLHKIGFATDPTISDIQYLFWVSQNRLREGDALSVAKQQAFLHRLNRAATTTPHRGQEDDGRRNDEDIEEGYTEEEQKIIDDAKKNGTYMKAPNGKKSNLSPKQWVRVRTEAFKNWFGDWINDPANASKVLDENGEPMVVYHSYDNSNYDSGLVYMSADKNFSGEFGSNIDAVFVNLRNPYIAKDDILRDAEGNAIMFEGEPATIGYLDSLPSDYILWLQSNYDGVIGDSNTFVVAFEANQIKSATENVGTYDRKNKDIRYDEDIEEPLERSAKAVYEDRLNRVETVFSEAYQDAMVSLKTAQNAIAGDKEIPDSQNAYMAENLMHGKNKNEQDLFNRMFRDPLIATINKILNLTGMNWGDVDRYVYTKSGLERNREFFVRDWLAKERSKAIRKYDDLNDTEKSIYDRMANRIETDFEDGLIANEEEKNKKLTEALQKAHEAFLDKVESDWQHMKEARYHDLENGYSVELSVDNFTYADYLNALSDFIRNNVDESYNPSEHDYSGFRAMFGDAEGKYDEKDIIDELMNTEDAINTDPDGNTTGTVDTLWEQIRNATRYGLERYREAGMRSDEQIDQVEQMFHWYVPMRGFKEDRGEDMYQYFTGKGNTKNYVGGLLKHAKGRGSEANYPISTIFAMTYKAISDCNQNLVNQKLYRLCQANPNDLIILSDSWVVLNEQTGLWEESSPEIPADASEEDVREATLAWEEQMKNLANEGKAMKITGRARFDYVPMDKQKKSEHEIDVRINGKPRKMFVVGNPRMAQALNGQLRFENGRNIFSKWNANIKNFMASLFTSYSPTFALRNLFRDWTHFRMMLGVREGEGYAKQANKYYRQTLFKMVGLFKKYREGTLDENNEVERDFKDFMDNGGITGFVFMQKIDDIQKEMKKLYEQQKEGKAIKLNNKLWDYTLGAIEAVNEGIENNARFATYRASRHYAQRTKARSAYDAKEITVNFNRKGSGGKTAGFKSQSKAVEDAAKAFGVTSQILGEGRIFFNATVQAIATTFKNFQNSDGSLNKPYIAKWAGRYAIPPFMFGLALPLINKALAAAFDGDDDDDPYANLAEWTRRKNICIYIGNNNFITIPIGQELAAFLTLGDIFAGNTYAQELKPVDKGITDELLGAMNTFSPLDIDTKITKGGLTKKPLDEVIGRTFSVLAPLVAVQQNIGWTGRPIYREDLYKDDKYTPEYQMVYNSTNPVLVSASKYLHELGGGDDVVRGKEWSEVNPAIVQYLWEQYTGGPGKVFANTISIGKDLKDLFNGETPDFNMRKVEGLKAFVQQGDDRTSYYRVNAKWRKYKEDAEALKNKIKGYEGLSEVDPTARSKYEKLSKSKEFERMDIAHSASKYLNKMNKYINKAEGSERNALKEQYNKRVKEVVDMLDSVK